MVGKSASQDEALSCTEPEVQMQQVHGRKERALTRGGLTNVAPIGQRSKACREKSDEVIVPRHVTSGRTEDELTR